TPNGKIDIDSLPEQISPAGSEATYIGPQTQLERTIAGVWQEVLAVDRVGIHDNYFELGGHSILMIQVHARLKTLLNRELSITDLFRYPTVSALAKHVSADDVEEPARSHILERARRQKEARTRRDRFAKARSK